MMIKKPVYNFINIFILGILFFSFQTSHAAVIHDRTFSDTYQFGKTQLKLRGGGFKRYLGFKALVGCLYLEEDVDATDALSDVPKKLEIEYLLKIPGAEIAQATEIGIQNNISEQEYQRLRAKIDLANSLWPNVKRGDRYNVTYIPGHGTSFEFNGKLQRVIEGDDFGNAFFAIWLGEKPIDKRLKEKLLGIKD